MAERVLIIDDDIYIRDLYEEVLKGEGYDVVTASDGEEGLARLLEGGFAAILMDIMMPKIDGIGVLTKVHETTPSLPNGPILLLTNLDHDPMLQQAKTLGAYTHLIKADTLPPTLVAAVKSAIAASSGHSQPGQ